MTTKFFSWTIGIFGGLFALDYLQKLTKDNSKDVKFDDLGKKKYDKTQHTMNVLRSAANSDKPLYLMSQKELKEFSKANK